MEILVWLVLGLVAGVAAMLVVLRTFPTHPAQWIGALVVGLLGGWIGGWLATLLGLAEANWVGSLVVGFVGASLVLWGVRKGLGAPAERPKRAK